MCLKGPGLDLWQSGQTPAASSSLGVTGPLLAWSFYPMWWVHVAVVTSCLIFSWEGRRFIIVSNFRTCHTLEGNFLHSASRGVEYKAGSNEIWILSHPLSGMFPLPCTAAGVQEAWGGPGMPPWRGGGRLTLRHHFHLCSRVFINQKVVEVLHSSSNKAMLSA